jgi:hypothetical protein
MKTSQLRSNIAKVVRLAAAPINASPLWLHWREFIYLEDPKSPTSGCLLSNGPRISCGDCSACALSYVSSKTEAPASCMRLLGGTVAPLRSQNTE